MASDNGGTRVGRELVLQTAQRLVEVRGTLAKITDLREVKKVRDQAEALRAYVRVQRGGLEAQNDCAEIKLRAERRAGEILEGKVKQGGDRRAKSNDSTLKLKDLGIKRDESSLWQRLAKVEEAAFARYLRECREAYREITQVGLLGIVKDQRREAKASEDEEAYAKAKAEQSGRKVEELADLRVCSMRDLLRELREVDAIITDPPYGKEWIPLYGELAKLAKAALRPEGLLAVMCGHIYLPEVLALMVPFIEYRWTMAYLTPGPAAQIWPRKIYTSWKPVLLFGTSKSWIFDVVSSERPDKSVHEWGQSESGMADLVEKLTEPGQLVCDPFLGGGTTAVVSLAQARRFVGCDIESKCVEATRVRLLTIRGSE